MIAVGGIGLVVQFEGTSMEITRSQFLEQRHRRFGRENPERMGMPFWEMMVRCRKYAYWARKHFDAENDDGAVWCFDRFGMSETTLRGGRMVYIAGEHEDHYDPDFCIYNDVVVKHPDGRIEIFGYPREVFPPTDFHSATAMGDRIIVVGSIGYGDERRPGYAPVYSLGVADFRMSRMETSGDSPGWLSKHEAELTPNGLITIKGGQVMETRAGKYSFRQNLEDWSLDPGTGMWQRLIHRNWPQFTIRAESLSWLSWGSHRALDYLCPMSIPHTVAPGEEFNKAVLLVEGVAVSVTLDCYDLRIVVQGSLPDSLINRLLEEIRVRAETIVKGLCKMERL